MRESMNYTDWLKTVPLSLTGDPLWTVEAYRLALFCADVAWRDVTKLVQDKRTLDLTNQLYDAIGSIGANISEGYSRGSGRDRVRFYEYALGSARESRTWYYDARHILGETITDHRLRFLTQIIRLLLTMIPEQRGQSFHDDPLTYMLPTDRASGDELLTHVPLP